MSEFGEDSLCSVCLEVTDNTNNWRCNICRKSFHKKCICPNENIKSWSCPHCKKLKVPSPPKSRHSSRKTNQSKDAELELEMIAEESKLLAKHREEKEKLIADAEKSLKEQQEKELQLLHKKNEALRKLSTQGSSQSRSSVSSVEKVDKWEIHENPVPAVKQMSSVLHGNASKANIFTYPHSTINFKDNAHDVNLSRDALAARQVVDVKLPKFDGNPLEWQRFYSKFVSTTLQCNITPAENVDRLGAALSGNAYNIVKFKLLNPNNLESIISTLKRVYGRDDQLLNVQIQEMRSLRLRLDSLDSIIQYAMSVQNIYESINNMENSRDHLVNHLLLQEMVEKLPTPIKLEWAEFRSNFSEPNIEVFSNWLFEKAMKITDVMGTTVKFSNENKKSQSFLHFHDQKTKSCVICHGECKSLEKCLKFINFSVSERWTEVNDKEKNICRSCLKQHKSRCRANIHCNIDHCSSRHNPLLHQEKRNVEDRSASNVELLNAHKHDTSPTLFKYVPIIIYGNKKSISTFAFLDDGSSVTVMEQNLADELGLNGKKEPLCLKWTSNESRTEDNSQLIKFSISGKNSSKKFLLSARTVASLDLPKQTISKNIYESSHKYLKNIPIDWYENAKPQILIGLDNANVTMTTSVQHGKEDNNLLVGSTKLGWILYGASGSQKNCNVGLFHICDCSAYSKLLETVESYVVQDNLTVKDSLLVSKDEERAINIMESTTKYISGRYETGLIWKYDSIQVPLSYSMAKRRLLCLERRLQKEPLLAEQLQKEIESYLAKGYAIKLDCKSTNLKTPSWYLPIFLVKNPNKPDKIRLVWDAAAKTGNVSLNSLLLKGPDLLTSLPGILCRFRQKKVAISGDISEMFHQIAIKKEDQPFLRFLYRTDASKEPDVYQMRVMIFGANCSPTSAQYVKNLNAKKFSEQYPRASYSIIFNHYVDDMLDSVDDEFEAIKLAKEVHKIHSFGGFNIRGWISNKDSVIKALCNNEIYAKKNLDMGSNTEKVLGMWWDTEQDTFTFSLKFNKGNKELLDGHIEPTKREVLKVVMSVFDPLGLLSHLIVYAKILFQEIWRDKIEWDSKIGSCLYGKWQEWLFMLRKIEAISIPRCYHKQFCSDRTELHIFVDASESAYAAAIYVRIETEEEVQCVLVAAKTKVCPLKGLTIPRMELNAAVLGCRLNAFVLKNHNISFHDCIFWTDSKTVLSWLKSDSRNYHQYISSRVAEILTTTNESQWRWIPSEHNVADLATKMKCVDLSNNGVWFSGPSFLRKNKHEWPTFCEDLVPTKEELKSSILHKINFHKVVSSPEQHSSWRPLLRAQAFVCRFVHNMKSKLRNLDKRSNNLLTKADFIEAEHSLLKQSQRESFFDDICDLEKKNNISKNSHLYPAMPYLTSEGILMSRGRVYDTIILDRNNHITKLIMMDYHRRFHHHYHETVVNELMQRFKIAKLRTALNSVIRSCQKCKNESAKPKVPIMSILPQCRLQPFTRPFSYVGIDYFGPINVTVGRSTQKRYGVLITCLTVRAVHIEIAHSLTTDSCIVALRNFMNRRGCPLEIYSDNAKNFAGCSKELRENYKNNVCKNSIAEKFTNENTQWFFIPPASPHMGGAWERLVRSIKNTFKKIACQRNPTDELLISMMIEVEHIINSRPLTYIPLENESSEVITPNHFLLGSSSGVRRYGEFSDENELLFKNWKRAQQFTNSFQKRWVRDYLPSLNFTPKWRDPVKELRKGDIVVLFDEKSFCNSYPKGIVLEVFPSKDGHVRQAQIKTSTGTYVRPAAKLAILDVGICSESDRNLDTLPISREDVSGGSVNDAAAKHLAELRFTTGNYSLFD